MIFFRCYSSRGRFRAKPSTLRASQSCAAARGRGQDKGLWAFTRSRKFATLTRLPVQPRIHPVEAARILTDNILTHFEAVGLGKDGYREALNTTSSGGWIGGKVYDALLLRGRVRVQRIYTFNLRDFRRLAPAGLQGEICAP